MFTNVSYVIIFYMISLSEVLLFYLKIVIFFNLLTSYCKTPYLKLSPTFIIISYLPFNRKK